jgi:hypothetical protein
MQGLLLDSLGVPGLLASFLVGFYFFTRIPWWMKKVCVPSAGVVEMVRAEAPLWRVQARKWIFAIPERLSVWGFFTFLIWPVMVFLNLLLLAQVLEIVPPGGERIRVWSLGSYTLLSLLGGALFSISQTVFAVAAGEAKRKSLVVVFLVLLLFTIGVQMGLAGYCAATFVDRYPPDAGSAGHQLVSNGVPMAMLQSSAIPLAHTVLGFVAVPRFVLPLTAYLPRLVLGSLYWAWSWFCTFYFGFQKRS